MSDGFDLRGFQPAIISLGSHPGIIQSMLDYAYCIEQERPNMLAIISAGRKQERYFWGHEEIVVPVYAKLSDVPDEVRSQATALLNVQSARRVRDSMKEALEMLPNLKVANIFAEQVPEAHALEIAAMVQSRGVLVAGPSSVGILVPGKMKLGAIGGIKYPQLVAAGIFAPGHTAVVSTSGGMVNELIHTVTKAGHGVSFGIALGGDRYPVTSPAQAFLLAEADSATEQIVYFGELGGEDEYEIADLISDGKVNKPVIAYIAGTVAELFAVPPQFGHAKAMASQEKETAKAKKEALRTVGVNVLDVFADLATELSAQSPQAMETNDHQPIKQRRKSMIMSHISGYSLNLLSFYCQLLRKNKFNTIRHV